MSDRDKKVAAEHAGRAARQMKHAVRNSGEAAEAAAEAMKDEVVGGASTAKSTMKDIAQKAITTEVGRGILFVSFGLITAAVGVKKFQEAKQMHARLADTLIKVEPQFHPEA